jgi:UMF1 family MFS transporter
MKAFFDTLRGRRLAWYLYDFGNSAYAATVILAIFPTYFKDVVVGGPEGTRLWGFANAGAMLVVTLISPILGALADQHAITKRLLVAFTLPACLLTAALGLVGQGDVFMAVTLFILAEISYRTAQIFYNAILPDIAERDEMGRISGNGWAIGSIGGIICLLMVLPMQAILGDVFVPFAMVFTAVFFALGALPLMLFATERERPARAAGEPAFSWTVGFRQIAGTFRRAREYRDYMVFLIAFLFLNDAVMIVLSFAAIIGATLYGFDGTQIIVLMIIVQITNVIGSWIFGLMTDRISGRTAMFWSGGLLALAVLGMMTSDSTLIFYILALVAGFAIAGQQSVSRTLVAKLSPKSQSAEFFGLFSVAGRTSSMIGPALFGWLAAEFAADFARSGMEAGAAEEAGMRIALGVILAFIAVGSLLLLMMRDDKLPRPGGER